MATKNELEKSKGAVQSAVAYVALPTSPDDHAQGIMGFWRSLIEGWKYPTGQARHGGRLWRKRMDEQVTMELADAITYWPTHLAHLAAIDERLAIVQALTQEVKAAIETPGQVNPRYVKDVVNALAERVTEIQNIRAFGNPEGESEEER